MRRFAVFLAMLSACSRDAWPDENAASDAAAVDTPKPEEPANILLVIGDDIGLDASVCHQVAADPGRAPRIQSICARGVVFDNVWATPLCSPTRASILTGRHGFRTTVGTAGDPLPLSERALPRALVEGNAQYAVAAVGKWHLSNATNGGPNHPNMVGFSHFAGSMGAQVPDYSSWSRVVNGVMAPETQYATTVTVNDAREWIAEQTRPWLMWLAFNAGHSPFHIPPADLHTYTMLPGPPLPPRPVEHYHAMIEAMDTELGRLLDGLSPAVLARTWIIFLGDNGTPSQVTQPPVSSNRAKGSVYQGGVQVPLAIAGPGVVGAGRRVDALVHSVDLFKTILQLAKVDMTKALPAGSNTVDSVSLVPYLEHVDQTPLRPWVMSEVFGGGFPGESGKTIRDKAFKLIRFDNGSSELYDLRSDPYEGTNLMASGPLSEEAEAHRSSLTAALDALLASP
jgi:arylsulfatase A-like enzyme